MSRPVHLRAVHAAGHRIINRSHYRTDDLVALVEALQPWLRAVVPTPVATPPSGGWPLIFVSARTPAMESEPDDASTLDVTELLPWIRRRGEAMIVLASPHGTAAPSLAAGMRPSAPDGLPEPFVRFLCAVLAYILHYPSCGPATSESIPVEIARMPVHTRRAHGVVVRARVRNGILFARAKAVEASAHARLVALRDASLQARRLLVRLEAHLPAPALHDTLLAFDAASGHLESDLRQAQASLRGPVRPTRTLYRNYDVPGCPWEERAPAPMAPLCVAPGPHVSALGSVEIENHTVYRTADLLDLVNRVEAFAAHSQGVEGAPRIARAVQVATPLGHLPRLSFVHPQGGETLPPDPEVAPLVKAFWNPSVPLTAVVLRAPDERSANPLRLLCGALPRPRPADLRDLAAGIRCAFQPVPREERRPALHGLRLRVARYATRSAWPCGPTATRRAQRICGELRAAMEVLREAVDAAAVSERDVAHVLDALHTDDRFGRRMAHLETPLGALGEALDAIEARLASPSRGRP
jgi:hypothetical protein